MNIWEVMPALVYLSILSMNDIFHLLTVRPTKGFISSSTLKEMKMGQ